MSTVLIGGLLLSLLVAGGMGLLLARSVLGQLGGEPSEAAELAQRIAQGELDTPIHVKAGDTRSLMFAMKTMATSLREIVTTIRADMDKVTQQNAALVEEGATAAETLRDQARRLADAVSVFKLA